MAGLDHSAKELRAPTQRPVAFKDIPQGQRGREDAQEEVRDGQGDDEGVPGVFPELLGGQDDGNDGQVEDAAEADDGDVEAQEETVDWLWDFQVPQDFVKVL